MAAISNSFEGGTNATAVTAVNSGGVSGTAFNSVAGAVTGATLAYSSTHAAHGSLALQIATSTTAGSQWVGWTTGFGTQSDFYVRFNMYLTAYPAASATLWRTFSAGAVVGSINLTTAGILRTLDSTGASIAGVATSTSLPLNQWIRVEAHFTVSATAGQVELKVFNTVDSTVPDFSAQSGAEENLGAASTDAYRLGLQSSQANFPSTWFDDYALSTTGYPGPAGTPANLVPTVTVAGASAAPYGETISASVSASDRDGTIASYHWYFTSQPTGSVITPTTPSATTTTFTPDKLGTYVLRCDVTDNQGGVGFSTLSVGIDAAMYIWTGSTWQPAYEQVWNGTSWS
jgi:hypothetical protein